jgi:hypothetical protein
VHHADDLLDEDVLVLTVVSACVDTFSSLEVALDALLDEVVQRLEGVTRGDKLEAVSLKVAANGKVVE